MRAAEGRPTHVLMDVDSSADADQVKSASVVILPSDLPRGTEMTLTQTEALIEAYARTADCYYEYGCLSTWGNDDKCHLPCNNSVCDWDMGDCNVTDPILVQGRKCPPGAVRGASVI